jgi:hypothetical protein
MRTRLLAPLAVLLLGAPASAAVIVVANYTPAEVAFTITEPGGKPRKETLAAHQVAAFVIAGPADMTAPADAKMPLRVEPYNAYVFIPDRAAGVRVELIELPGKPLEADAKPERKPLPRDPVKIPVTLLVDDADPRVDAFWQEETRKRFDRAAGILEAQTGFRLELAGFDTWKSDPNAKQVEGQLAPFEASVAVKQGSLAIGFISRKLEVGKDVTFGACSGRGARHVLVREWLPKSEAERVEVLVRYLAVALGATTTPDPGSVMRAKLGDCQALKQGFVTRLDPLNVLALNLWADQWRAGSADPKVLPAPDRTRLLRVYKAMLLASPEDTYAPDIIRDLEKDLANGADPAIGKRPPLTGDRLKRADAVRAVVRAITDRAKANTGTAALTGDALTAELFRVAADAAMKAEEPDRAPAFLLGLGIALDDGASLRDSPLTGAAVRDIETDAERKERLAVLGNPTLRGRRDLCKRFAVGCGAGELLTPAAAENAAVNGSLLSVQRPAGFSFPSLAAECAGIAFARSVEADSKRLLRLRDKFSAADLLPGMVGLRDGIGADKFEDDFGGPSDERFRTVLADIQKRVKALPVNKVP